MTSRYPGQQEPSVDIGRPTSQGGGGPLWPSGVLLSHAVSWVLWPVNSPHEENLSGQSVRAASGEHAVRETGEKSSRRRCRQDCREA